MLIVIEWVWWTLSWSFFLYCMIMARRNGDTNLNDSEWRDVIAMSILWPYGVCCVLISYGKLYYDGGGN